jgi:hypothetical protein
MFASPTWLNLIVKVEPRDGENMAKLTMPMRFLVNCARNDSQIGSQNLERY